MSDGAVMALAAIWGIGIGVPIGFLCGWKDHQWRVRLGRTLGVEWD